MRTIHQVDWVDEHGKRHRKSFANTEEAMRFEQLQRSTVLIKRAAHLKTTIHDPRLRGRGPRRHEIRLDRTGAA